MSASPASPDNLLEPQDSFPHSAFQVWRARQQLNHRASRQMGCGLRDEGVAVSSGDERADHESGSRQPEVHSYEPKRRSPSPEAPYQPSSTLPFDLSSDTAPLRGFLSASTRKLSTYKTALCRSWEENRGCRYAAKCLFAHGPGELRSRSRRSGVRGEYCKQYLEHGSCTFGQNCIFVHPAPTNDLSSFFAPSRTSLNATNELVLRQLQSLYQAPDALTLDVQHLSPATGSPITAYTSELGSPPFASRRSSVTEDEDYDEEATLCPPVADPSPFPKRTALKLDLGSTLPSMAEEPPSPRVTVTRRSSGPVDDGAVDTFRLQAAITTSFGPPSPPACVQPLVGAADPPAVIPFAIIAFGIEPSPSLAGCWPSVLAAFSCPPSAVVAV